MRFAQPEYLYALAVAPLLLIFYIVTFRRKALALARFGNPLLLARLSVSVSPLRQKIKVAMLLCGLVCCILALARPQMGTRVEMVKQEGFEIMVALDVSNSMMAEDIQPNRLERAKHAIRTLVSRLKGDRIGLVVFAGAAFLQCPMTSDYGAIELFLSGVDNETVGVQGTEISQALQTALRGFDDKPRDQKVVVLLTDGEGHDDDPVGTARELAKQGIRVYAVGVGTPFGELIPIRDAQGNVVGHRKDGAGSVVMSQLDEVTLQQIAAETNGAYYPSTLGEQEIDDIYSALTQSDKAAFESRQITQYEERYQYLLVFGLLFFFVEAIISDRKKIKLLTQETR